MNTRCFDERIDAILYDLGFHYCGHSMGKSYSSMELTTKDELCVYLFRDDNPHSSNRILFCCPFIDLRVPFENDDLVSKQCIAELLKLCVLKP